jgi:hypothetical protein
MELLVRARWRVKGVEKVAIAKGEKVLNRIGKVVTHTDKLKIRIKGPAPSERRFSTVLERLLHTQITLKLGSRGQHQGREGPQQNWKGCYKHR